MLFVGIYQLNLICFKLGSSKILFYRASTMQKYTLPIQFVIRLNNTNVRHPQRETRLILHKIGNTFFAVTNVKT